MHIARSLLAAALIAVLAWAGAPVDAIGKDGQSAKVNPALRALFAEHAAHLAERGAVPFASANRRARIAADRVVVDAVADGDDARALEAELASLGMVNRATFGRVVSGELPIAAIPALDSLRSLRFARPSYAGRRAGLVTSQGDHAIGADAARASLAVTGAGVPVGVLSDSFNCLGGAADNVASGDLSPVTVVQEISSCTDGADEGRAILQVVHDVAPGAPLSFASAFNGEASFASNIVALQAAGALVLVDDIVYFDEPMFQDGIIAQAVDAVVARGAAFFSAAGNNGSEGYESAFRAGASFANGQFPSAAEAPHFFGGIAHNFAPSGPPVYMQSISVPSGDELIISLQWDSPFFSVSGGAGSPNDVDVYLLDATGTEVVAGSADENIGGDPVEIIDFVNRGPGAIFNLMIVSNAGPVPGYVKYIQLGDTDIAIRAFDTASGTVFGHTNAAGVAAVGAAFYADTPAFGVSPPMLESYSSSGPTRILFDTAGNRLADPIIRDKPELVGPDGVSTTFFGQPAGPGAFPRFFGTSAAAPHAAAAAALMLERQPALWPAAVYLALERTAVNMGPPGFDFDSGFGFIQAGAALQFVSVPQVSLGVTATPSTISAGDPLTVTLALSNAGAATTVDIYLAVLVPLALSIELGCPAGDGVVFLTSGFGGATTVCRAAALGQGFPPLFASAPVAAAQQPFSLPQVLNTAWPSGIPAGIYTFALFTTAPGAVASGGFTPSGITALASTTLQALP